MTEAILIVFDVGRSAGKELSSNGATFFENAKRCASMIIQRKIFSNSKDEMGLIILGSENTNNPLAEGDQYKNIEVVHSLQLPHWGLVKSIAGYKTTTTHDGDWLDALVVALDFMKSSTEGKKFSGKQIVLFTNFCSNVSDDEVDFFIDSIKKSEVEIVVIGPSLYKSDSQSQDAKSEEQAEGEKLIAKIVSETNGVICSFEDAIPQLMNFEKKKRRSVGWRAVLEIGSVVKIPVIGYIKIAKCEPIKAKNVILPESDYSDASNKLQPATHHSDLHSMETNMDVTDSDGLVKVDRDHIYTTVGDNPAPVDAQDLIQGYKFGTTIIPISEDDKQTITYFSGEKCLSVIGFSSVENVSRRYFTGTGCHYFFPEKEENSVRIFSALVQAMHSKDMVAIVRKVYRKDCAPQVGALLPRIEENYQCLVYIQLPFSQSVPTLVLPPLFIEDSKPTQDHLDAVDNLIDAMDLMCADENDDGEPSEAYRSEHCLDPYEQYVCHYIACSILKEDSIVKVTEAEERIKDMLVPKKELALKAGPALQRIQNLFPLTELKAKEGTRRAAVDVFQSYDKLGTGAPNQGTGTILPAVSSIKQLTQKIGTLRPQEDFMSLIAQRCPFNDACSMMQDVIMDMVANAFGDVDEFRKPFKTLTFLREKCTEENPNAYNDWISKIKKTLVSEKVEFWELLVKDNQGLISNKESKSSSISEEEAKAFLHFVKKEEDIPMPQANDEDLDDLINQM